MTRAAAAWRELPGCDVAWVMSGLGVDDNCDCHACHATHIARAVLREAARQPVVGYYVRAGTVRKEGGYYGFDHIKGCSRWGTKKQAALFRNRDDAEEMVGRVVAVRARRTEKGTP